MLLYFEDTIPQGGQLLNNSIYRKCKALLRQNTGHPGVAFQSANTINYCNFFTTCSWSAFDHWLINLPNRLWLPAFRKEVILGRADKLTAKHL